MPFTFNWIDLLFAITIILLVFNGFRNGLVASLLNLLGIPLGVLVALALGRQFIKFLGANGLDIAPLLAYIILFLATVLVVHIIATVVRGSIRKVGLGCVDQGLGAAVGFAEAWLLWIAVLFVVHNLLTNVQNVPGIDATQFIHWQQAYNYTITNSLFAQVNNFIITKIPINR